MSCFGCLLPFSSCDPISLCSLKRWKTQRELMGALFWEPFGESFCHSLFQPSWFLPFLLSYLPGESFVFALTFLTKAELRPITIGIYNAIGQYGIKYNELMAYSVVAIAPVIIIFVSLQKYIRSGLVIGGIKG